MVHPPFKKVVARVKLRELSIQKGTKSEGHREAIMPFGGFYIGTFRKLHFMASSEG
jgi:hypothetical protein